MNDARDLTWYLQEFSRYKAAGNSSFDFYDLDDIGDDRFVLRPKQGRQPLSTRSIDLCVLGLVHGNEVGGLAVIVELLNQLATGIWQPPLAIAFVLGDVRAAQQHKRYLEADLNRSFGLAEAKLPAQQRARELQYLFESCYFVIDLHQTQGPTAEPFFISKYDKYSLGIFKLVFPDTPAVVYWESSFSKSGMTTVNYHVQQGGYGFCIELGEKGFDPVQISFGVALITKVCNALVTNTSELIHENLLACHNIYTFDRVFTTTTGVFQLAPDFGRNVFYWRDGNHEVDFVISADRQLIAVEVKSGRKKSTLGLKKFKESFPKSKSILIDLELAERLLLSEHPKQFFQECISG